MSEQIKRNIQTAIHNFRHGDLRQNGLTLLKTLGYESDLEMEVGNTAAEFLDTFNGIDNFHSDKALVAEWDKIELLCQIDDGQVNQSTQLVLMDSVNKVINNAIIESYLFIALELAGSEYTRTALAQITREINKLFRMPAMLIFKHGDTLTLSIINRRLNKRDSDKDVLEKVTLIKDIRITNPHRAHVEILFDLSLDELHRQHDFSNFVGLHRAWQKTLDSSELNKKFFKEVANWYFWAVNEVEFPPDAGPDETRNATSVIRLITRLIFVWFLKEKGLVPDALFNKRELDKLVKWDDFNDSTYYKAILQNLFFATLNQEMNTDQKTDNRKFRGENKSGRDQHHMIHNVYRYKKYFQEPEKMLALTADIPFLNGGLFECLDRKVDGKTVRIDGFSDRTDSPLKVPDDLFFGVKRRVDLNDIYDTSGKTYEVRGLIDTLNQYKFTITENTPIEEEIALDPELLGKVFENLLAAYNPETGTTARKQTGSFYTPREIVNYMVDESLIAHFETRLAANDGGEHQERLRHLLAYNEEPHQFAEPEVAMLIEAINEVKILDPACGSGAFPMGILHKLVFVLGKLDPKNAKWKEHQITPIRQAIEAAKHIPDSQIRDQTIAELEERIELIEDAFTRNALDYGRKLYLIENCIYGVDIQPVAVQIAKLRFFISLVVEQNIDDEAPNRGIMSLPNLETKFVAANALLGIKRPKSGQWNKLALRNISIAEKEKQLADVRSKHFRARTPSTKEKYRKEDKRLRAEIGELLLKDGFPSKTTIQLASWDPYNQNLAADFFDSEWMFGVVGGFDITIGNPPYVRADSGEEHLELRERIKSSEQYETLWEKWDLFIAFIELGFKLLKPDAATTMIVSDAYCHAKYALKSQEYFRKNSQILKLDFYSKIKIFDATVHNISYLFKNAEGSENKPERRVHYPEFGKVELLQTDIQSQLDHRLFFPQDVEVWEFDVPILRLEEIVYISVGMVVNAHEKRAPGAFALEDLVSEHEDTEHPKPFVEGKHLDRWLPITNYWLEWGTDRAPRLFRRPTFPELYAVNEKLISVDMAAGIDKLKVTYDDQQLHHNHSAWSFVPWHSLQGVRNRSIKKQCRYIDEKPVRPDLPKREKLEENSRRFSVKYILGIMNSTHSRDFLHANRRSNIHLYPNDWKNLPVPDVSGNLQAPVVQIVESIIDTKKNDPLADISTLESQLDQQVFKLFNDTTPKAAQNGIEVNAQIAEPQTTNITTLIFSGQPPQGSFSQRMKRVQALGKEDSPAAIQELTAALTDENDNIVWLARAGLRRIGGPQVIGVLQSFIAQTDHEKAKAEAEKILETLTQ